MRVMFWADSWWPAVGGIEVLGAHCVRGLKLQGVETLVVTSHGEGKLPDEAEHNGIPVHRFAFHEALRTRRLDLFAQALKRLRQLKRSWRPDIVHVHFPAPSGIFQLQTSDAQDAPLLLAMHTHVPEWDAGPDTLSGKLLRRSAWVTANSGATLDLARGACPEIAERSSIIYNGLPAPRIAPAPLPWDPPVIACLGRLVHKKGIDIAIRAMPSVRATISGARMLVAGDGPERAELERLRNGLGLEDCVEFRGWIAPDQIAGFVNEATVVAIPSRSMEPFGNVAVEAMQMARPVVASNLGGLPEVVADGETGVLCPADDVEALARSIARLAGDRGLASAMGEAGRRRAQIHFGLERYVADYMKLYKTLAG